MITQLKPYQEAFLKFATDIRRNFDAIILCEGRTDAEIIKAIIKKIGLTISRRIAVTDCEGIEQLKTTAKYIAVLTRNTRKLKKLAVIVDQDIYKPRERAQSLIDALRSENIETSTLEKIDTQLFKATINNKTLIIAVAGDPELPFKTHTIEDHIAKAKIYERKLSTEDVTRYDKAKDVVKDPVKQIEEIKPENIEKAFKTIIELIKTVT